MPASSEQLEREADAIRMQMRKIIEEMRYRITPRQVVDELVDHAHDMQLDKFVTTVGRRIVDRPIAVALVGFGLAWLTLPFASRRVSDASDAATRVASSVAGGAKNASGSVRDATTRAAEQAEAEAGAATQRTASGTAKLRDSIGDIAASASEAASDAAARARRETRARTRDYADRASRAADRLGEAAAAGYDTVSQSTANAAERFGEAADSLRRGIADAAPRVPERLIAFGREQPLLLAGAGLAVGTLIGALLRRTRTTGQESSATKEAVEARKGVEAMKEVAQETIAEIADDVGIVPDRHEHSTLEADREGKGLGRNTGTRTRR